MRLPEEPDRPLSINLVPMIDTIFAILTFFIIGTLFLTRSPNLSVELSNNNQPLSSPTQTTLTLTLQADGSIVLNQTPISFDQLENTLRPLLNPKGDTLILINVDRLVNYGRVAQVMDHLRPLERVKISISPTQP